MFIFAQFISRENKKNKIKISWTMHDWTLFIFSSAHHSPWVGVGVGTEKEKKNGWYFEKLWKMHS